MNVTNFSPQRFTNFSYGKAFAPNLHFWEVTPHLEETSQLAGGGIEIFLLFFHRKKRKNEVGAWNHADKHHGGCYFWGKPLEVIESCKDRDTISGVLLRRSDKYLHHILRYSQQKCVKTHLVGPSKSDFHWLGDEFLSL